jgi:hypothetical protein
MSDWSAEQRRPARRDAPVTRTQVAEATGSPALAELAQPVFGRHTLDSRAWTAHGYGIKVTVQSGHLVVTDGIGTCRRSRKLPRIDRTLRRIVITGADGYVSLAALRWCKDHHIAIVTVNPFGELTAASAHCEPPDAPTLRA